MWLYKVRKWFFVATRNDFGHVTRILKQKSGIEVGRHCQTIDGFMDTMHATVSFPSRWNFMIEANRE